MEDKMAEKLVLEALETHPRERHRLQEAEENEVAIQKAASRHFHLGHWWANADTILRRHEEEAEEVGRVVTNEDPILIDRGIHDCTYGELKAERDRLYQKQIEVEAELGVLEAKLPQTFNNAIGVGQGGDPFARRLAVAPDLIALGLVETDRPEQPADVTPFSKEHFIGYMEGRYGLESRVTERWSSAARSKRLDRKAGPPSVTMGHMAKRSYAQGRKYAEDTSVPVDRSQGNIRKLVASKGATSYALIEDEGTAIVSFKMAGFVLQFRVEQPPDDQAQEQRRIWRCLELTIKSKLTAAEAGIETFQQAFLANIVIAGGQTVGDVVIPQLDKGKALKLLSARTR